jgi:hypothetical protein
VHHLDALTTHRRKNMPRGPNTPKKPAAAPVPTAERISQPSSIEAAQDAWTLAEAAEKVGLTVATVRAAIRTGELKAFIPRGRDPLNAGPGNGYRIEQAELERWYLGGKA